MGTNRRLQKDPRKGVPLGVLPTKMPRSQLHLRQLQVLGRDSVPQGTKKQQRRLPKHLRLLQRKRRQAIGLRRRRRRRRRRHRHHHRQDLHPHRRKVVQIAGGSDEIEMEC